MIGACEIGLLGEHVVFVLSYVKGGGTKGDRCTSDWAVRSTHRNCT